MKPHYFILNFVDIFSIDIILHFVRKWWNQLSFFSPRFAANAALRDFQRDSAGGS